jgi:OCT family organic cation transporter-like MFS transporter 4/5
LRSLRILAESPRWLASRGREEEAVEVLTKIAKINGKTKPHRLELMVILEACKDDEGRPKRGNESGEIKAVEVLSACTNALKTVKSICTNYVNLVRTPELRKRSFILWTIFSSVSLVYYGVTFDSARLSSDPFFVVFLG